MNNIIKRNNLKVNKVTINKDVTTIDTPLGLFDIKKYKDPSIFDYLLSRGFIYIPKIIDYDDEYILARGTLDDKSSFFAILEATNDLLKNNFKPQAGFAGTYKFNIENQSKPLIIEVDGAELNVYYGDLAKADVEVHIKEEILNKAVSAVDYIKDHGIVAEFSCEDATRTELDYLLEVFGAVQEAKVDKINVPDTVGVTIPSKMNELITNIKEVIHVPISVHCHNDFGLAVANSLAAIEAGAQQAQCTINGLGERAGNASLEEIVMALHKAYNINTNIKSTI